MKGGENSGTQGNIFEKFKKIYGVSREKPKGCLRGVRV